MILFILLQNRQGKTPLAKYYVPLEESEKHKVEYELAYLECIHLFVEILDHFFSNVCELDLVFNFHKVYLILDEFILAGELQETSKRAIIERMSELEKLD
ncbi:hypothetical protein EUTSA_v10022930mg [Eutrema salsugineum]|uniref:AP complex subunit sigma n=1 Tax=Eutrema salsugineum TaxID=72664 RepID=V4M3N8_EUTSA|nr:hypothetical protein EUTSA_v10022930mg [Eutrema salsugineum]